MPVLFADDFVGASDIRESLQKHTDIVHTYCTTWRLDNCMAMANALVNFSPSPRLGIWAKFEGKRDGKFGKLYVGTLVMEWSVVSFALIQLYLCGFDIHSYMCIYVAWSMAMGAWSVVVLLRHFAEYYYTK